MFKCQKCNEERYLKYEEYIFKCINCQYLLRICCDCYVEQYKLNNLTILKKKMNYLLKHIIDIKTITKKIFHKKLPERIQNIILEYLNFQYIDILNNEYYSSKIDYNIQYINPFGLQINGDNGRFEYYSTPIFYCLKCLKKYQYYCLKNNKLY